MNENIFCAECGHMGFTKKDGKRIICQCRVQLKIKMYLKQMGYFVNPGPQIQEFIQVHFVKSRDYYIRMGAFGGINRIKGFLALALLSLWDSTGEHRSFQYINAYRLVDIWLGKSSEFETALLESFPQGILIISWGAQEARNKEIGQLVRQTVLHRQAAGKHTWFVELQNKPLPDTPKSFWEESQFKEVRVDVGSDTADIF